MIDKDNALTDGRYRKGFNDFAIASDDLIIWHIDWSSIHWHYSKERSSSERSESVMDIVYEVYFNDEGIMLDDKHITLHKKWRYNYRWKKIRWNGLVRVNEIRVSWNFSMKVSVRMTYRSILMINAHRSGAFWWQMPAVIAWVIK